MLTKANEAQEVEAARRAANKSERDTKRAIQHAAWTAAAYISDRFKNDNPNTLGTDPRGHADHYLPAILEQMATAEAAIAAEHAGFGSARVFEQALEALEKTEDDAGYLEVLATLPMPSVLK